MTLMHKSAQRNESTELYPGGLSQASALHRGRRRREAVGRGRVWGASWKPRLGFVVWILIAGGIHALILLVPRPAGRADEGIPTIELTLAIGAAETSVGVERAAPPARGGAIPAVQAAPIAAPSGPAEERREPMPHAAPSVEPIPAQDAAPAAAQAEDATAPEAAVVAPSAGPPGGTAGPAAPVGSAGPVGPGSFGAGTGAETGSGAVEATALGLTPPRPRAEIVPAYPRSARASGMQGTVKIAALIDESGALISAEVLASSGHASLDRAALEAVRRTPFEPAVLQGKAVLCRLIIPIRFQLN